LRLFHANWGVVIAKTCCQRT